MRAVGRLVSSFAVLAVVMPTAAAAQGLTWGKPIRVAPVPLESLSCPSTSFCAAGSSVDVFTTTSAFARRPRWAAHQAGASSAPIVGEMATISCVGRSLCVAADFDGAGEAVASSDPLAPGAREWYQLDDGPPGPFRADGLFGLSCASASLCVGGDGNGGQLEVTHTPTSVSRAWNIVAVPHGTYYCYAGSGPQPTTCSSVIDAVDCPSVNLCVSMDSSGVLDVSTDPGAAASTWARTPLVDDDFAPSYDELAAQISCPSVSFCAVVFDRTGQVFTSTDPAGGASAWHAHDLDDSYVQAISCASAGLCVAVDASGDALVSTDPASASPVWTRQKIDRADGLDRSFFSPQQSSLTGVACPSTSACVAVDGFGDEIVGRT